jgi:hypothetical protein
MPGSGERARDAVRVVRHIGLAALRKLRDPGPVLVDPAEKAVYFFVPTGSVAGWRIPGVGVISPAESLSLPAVDHSTPPGPYWLTAPAYALWCTPANELLVAITAALRDEKELR